MKKQAAAAGTKLLRKTQAVEKVSNFFKLEILSGKAAAGPPLGPLLGQRGVNIAAFVKDFNTRTKKYIGGVPLDCQVTVFPDRSYDLRIGTPPTDYLIMQAAGISSQGKFGSSIGYLTMKHIYEIAKLKKTDYYCQIVPIQELTLNIMDDAIGMGIDIVDEIDEAKYQQKLNRIRKEAEQKQKDDEEAEKAKLLRKA